MTIDGTKICNDPGDKTVSAPLVTILTAMKYSLNTTFDLLASQAGPDNVAAVAHAMGIAGDRRPREQDARRTRTASRTSASASATTRCTPLDQAVGFATLANRRHAQRPVLRQPRRRRPTARSLRAQGQAAAGARPEGRQRRHALARAGRRLVRHGLRSPAAGCRPRRPAPRASRRRPRTTATPGWSATRPQVSAAVWVGTGLLASRSSTSAGAPMYGADLPGKTWKLFMDTYLDGKPKLPMAKHADDQPGRLDPRAGVDPDPDADHRPRRRAATPAPTFSITTGFPSPSSPPVSSPPPPPPSSDAAAVVVDLVDRAGVRPPARAAG